VALTEESELREVKGIDASQRDLIKAFLQGAVYCWVKNRKGEQFAARDLMGGENAQWAGTPLKALHDKHAALGKDNAAANESAGRDLGWLLKAVLAEDKRTFEAGKGGLVSVYHWVKDAAVGAGPDA